MKNKSKNRLNRRSFIKKSSSGLLGAMALNSMAGNAFADSIADGTRNVITPNGTQAPHFQPKAKRVIFLHMAGGPSQLELFDYKPVLTKFDGKPCPEELLAGKKLAFAKGTPDMLGPQFTFKQYGKSGTWVSDRLPHFQGVVDEVTMIKAMKTNQFNHAPAQLMMHTGYFRLGRPSLGSWVTHIQVSAIACRTFESQSL